MKNKGQNIVEFIILLAVIALLGVIAYTFLGENINSMFFKSTEKAKKYEPFNFPSPKSMPNEAATVTPPDNQSPTSSPVASTKTINGVDISFHEDGSATMNINNQDIFLTSEMINSFDEVMESVGTQGVNDHIIAAIRDIIDRNKGKYPDDVPIEIAFGHGTRTMSHGTTYEGNASTLNLLQINVGGDVVIIQNDQSESWSGDIFNGKYRLDLAVNGNNFTLNDVNQLESDSSTLVPRSILDAHFGDYNGTIIKNPDGSSVFNGTIAAGTWDINFDKPKKIHF